MTHLVSVIVPIYRVERYLQTCVDSLLAQTYENLEIILVDDGSPDRCGEICDAYKAADPRIKVLHKPNGGLSDARNAGFAVSRGKYILFIDSDDYVDRTMVEQLHDACISRGAEMAVCYFDKVAEDQKPDRSVADKAEVQVLSGREIVRQIYCGEGEQIAFTAWNKLYHRELITQNKLTYPKGRYYEDEYVTHKLFYFAEKVAVVQAPLYHYRVRANSIMTTSLNRARCVDKIEGDMEAVVFFAQQQDAQLLNQAFYFYCRSSVLMYAGMCGKKHEKESRSCKQYVVQTYRKMWREFSGRIRLNAKQRLLCGGFLACPSLMGWFVSRIKGEQC